MQCLLVGIWEFSYSNTFATYVYQFIVGFKIAQVSTATLIYRVPSDADTYAYKTNELARVVQNRKKTTTLAPFLRFSGQVLKRNYM